MPTPALSAATTGGRRDDVVTISDVIAVLDYVGTVAAWPDTDNLWGASYGSDVDGDGIPDGAEYDGSEWNAGSGGVSISDVVVVLSHIGDVCVGR